MNKEIIWFLRERLDTLFAKGLRFEFELVDEANKSMLIQKGITELPTCVVGNRKFVGSTEIIAAMKKILMPTTPGPPSMSRPQRPRDPQEELREYQESMMTREAMARDEAEGDNDDARATMERDKNTKYDAMIKEREKIHNKASGQQVKTQKRDDNVGTLGIVPQKSKSDDIRSAVEKGNRDDMMLMQMMEET